jgi:hypothetical protein
VREISRCQSGHAWQRRGISPQRRFFGGIPARRVQYTQNPHLVRGTAVAEQLCNGYPPIAQSQGVVSPIAAGVAGAVIGGLASAGIVASRQLDTAEPTDEARRNSDA